MSVGGDIKEALEEIASSIIILRDAGDITGEYCDISINEQATKPFIISFFKKATFQYDTQVVSGDIVNFETTGDYYLTTTVNSEEFENEIITKQGVLYLCNTSGELSRPSGEVWNSQTYHKEQAYEAIRSNCYSLLVNPEFRNQLNEEEAAMISVEDNELFLPSSIGIAVNDRYEPYSGEYYKIEVVNKYRYQGVDVCRIVEDTR
jgi:hypothetical protein